MDMDELIDALPSKVNLERDLPLEIGREVKIYRNGDNYEGKDTYFLLTRERFIIKYYLDGNYYKFLYSKKLTETKWNKKLGQ